VTWLTTERTKTNSSSRPRVLTHYVAAAVRNVESVTKVDSSEWAPGPETNMDSCLSPLRVQEPLGNHVRKHKYDCIDSEDADGRLEETVGPFVHPDWDVWKRHRLLDVSMRLRFPDGCNNNVELNWPFWIGAVLLSGFLSHRRKAVNKDCICRRFSSSKTIICVSRQYFVTWVLFIILIILSSNILLYSSSFDWRELVRSVRARRFEWTIDWLPTCLIHLFWFSLIIRLNSSERLHNGIVLVSYRKNNRSSLRMERLWTRSISSQWKIWIHRWKPFYCFAISRQFHMKPRSM
jgi:hypothetical protein